MTHINSHLFMEYFSLVIYNMFTHNSHSQAMLISDNVEDDSV